MSKYDKASLGPALHTALRKACDSHPTSLAWNIINLINQGWITYLDIVHRHLVSGAEPVAALKAAAEELEMGNSERTALRLTFELFDGGDWDGFAAYLPGCKIKRREATTNAQESPE